MSIRMERRLLEAALGLYVAAVTLPAVLLLHGGPIDGPRALGTVLAGGLLVALIVALGARTVADLPETVASPRVAAATTLPPLAYLPYLVIETAPESPEAAVAVAGLLSILPGIGVLIAGTILRNRRLQARAEEIVVVTIGDDEESGRRWPVIAGLGVLGLSFIVLGIIAAANGDDSFGAIVPSIGGLSTWMVLLAAEESTEVTVTDAGLRIDRSFTPWADLEGYRVTDDAIELVRRQWYLPTRDFDREDISDERALLAGLEHYLPRLDDAGYDSAARPSRDR